MEKISKLPLSHVQQQSVGTYLCASPKSLACNHLLQSQTDFHSLNAMRRPPPLFRGPTSAFTKSATEQIMGHYQNKMPTYEHIYLQNE